MRRWWGCEVGSSERTADHYGAALRGEEPTDHYVIVVDHLAADCPEWDAPVETGEDAAGVDLLLGEEELTGRGLGPDVLAAFVERVVTASACVASVDEENRRSLRAFEKAGFRHVRDLEEDGRPHRLMRLDRAGQTISRSSRRRGAGVAEPRRGRDGAATAVTRFLR